MFESYMARVIVTKLDQKDTWCYNEIGLLRIQDLDIMLSSLGNTLEKVFVITLKGKGIFTSTSSNFRISTLIIKLEIAMFVICNC